MAYLSTIKFRSLLQSDSIDELTELLNDSYKSLADMGFNFTASFQDVDGTSERINRGKCFVAIDINKLVGTVCFYSKEKKGKATWYEKNNVAYYGQLAVLPKYQKKGIGSRLIELVENEAIINEAEEIAIDTAEGATYLINFYKKRNYRFVEFANWPTTNYRSVILSKKIINNGS